MPSRGDIFERNVPGTAAMLATRCVGIAGCGGLGSNAAVSLVRAGVGRLVLVDHDVVEPSNLNRQHFFQGDVGLTKVKALAGHLLAINPEVRLDLHDAKLDPAGLVVVFQDVDLLVEAFDTAESKRWLIDAWCRTWPDRPMICGNGLSGLGRTEDLVVTRVGNVHFCGDARTDLSMGLCSARVAIVANMQANVAIELLLGRMP